MVEVMSRRLAVIMRLGIQSLLVLCEVLVARFYLESVSDLFGFEG